MTNNEWPVTNNYRLRTIINDYSLTIVIDYRLTIIGDY